MNIASFLLGLASVLCLLVSVIAYVLRPHHPRVAGEAAVIGLLFYVLAFMALFLWNGHTVHIVHF